MFFTIIAAIIVAFAANKASHATLRTIGNVVDARTAKKQTPDYMTPNNNLTSPLDI